MSQNYSYSNGGRIWNNGAEEGTPSRSPYGQAIAAGMPALMGYPNYLPSNPEIHYTGFYGAFNAAFVPGVVPIWAAHGFQGDLPLSQQPKLDRPHPYDQPFRY